MDFLLVARIRLKYARSLRVVRDKSMLLAPHAECQVVRLGHTHRQNARLLRGVAAEHVAVVGGPVGLRAVLLRHECEHVLVCGVRATVAEPRHRKLILHPLRHLLLHPHLQGGHLDAHGARAVLAGALGGLTCVR